MEAFKRDYRDPVKLSDGWGRAFKSEIPGDQRENTMSVVAVAAVAPAFAGAKVLMEKYAFQCQATTNAVKKYDLSILQLFVTGSCSNHPFLHACAVFRRVWTLH